ncbi:Response regulator receiver domain-containing protein [Rhodoferax sp. OV413]|uniref:response regulator n=1 Tax=Rhodoferax sp. OV413 TaxID=1855285 RepID=UPI0008900AF1|nr:response regulator [Rhodoferax sp. OV413]SDO69773.1 Response regulator receiver domain-containing protein [Rhodoferax sp. OV413]
MRVVVLEDSAVVLRELELILRAMGAKLVFTTATADEAMDWFRLNPSAWDLVVIDLFLASGNGFQLLDICRGRSPAQRAVILSNYSGSYVREHALRAGADAFFDKSFDMEKMVDFCIDFHQNLKA